MDNPNEGEQPEEDLKIVKSAESTECLKCGHLIRKAEVF